MLTNAPKSQKLMAISATFMSMTEKKMEEKEKLEPVPYIWYLVTFKYQIEALLDIKSKVNTMSQAFTSQLGFKIQKTNIEAQKIDNTTLKTYEIIVSTFSILDKDNREKFFEESFFLADVKSNVVLGILFLTISNANIDFQAWNL